MPGLALYLRNQELSLRDIASRLVITPRARRKADTQSPGNLVRMLREHDQAAAAKPAPVTG